MTVGAFGCGDLVDAQYVTQGIGLGDGATSGKADDPEANLSGFANPLMAEGIDAAISSGLEESGAKDVSSDLRGGSSSTAVGPAWT